MNRPHVVQDEQCQHLLSAAVASIPAELHGLDVAEIGSGVGGSAHLIRGALDRVGNPAKLTCVDACTMGSGWTAMRTKKAFRDQEQALRHALSGLQNVELIVQASVVIRCGWPDDRPLSFIFVDGNHHYENVVQDLRWSEHVAIGGAMAIHDFGSQLKEWGHDGVTRGVMTFLYAHQNWRWIANRSSMLILQRTS